MFCASKTALVAHQRSISDATNCCVPTLRRSCLSVLAADLSVDCTTPEYRVVEVVSLCFFIVYGAGIPILFPLVGLVLHGIGGRELEMETLAFLYVGFKKEFRYWESVNMVRKLCIAAIMTFLTDVRLKVWRELHWKGGGNHPPTPSPQGPCLCAAPPPPLTASAGFNGFCNRQQPPPTVLATSSNRLSNRCRDRP